MVFHQVAQGSAEIVVASHNQASAKWATQKMTKMNMKSSSPVYFAQLYGMADYLTYSLASADYKVRCCACSSFNNCRKLPSKRVMFTGPQASFIWTCVQSSSVLGSKSS